MIMEQMEIPKAISLRIHSSFIIYGVPMLKKNKIITTVLILSVSLYFWGCNSYEKPSCYIGLTLVASENENGTELIKVNPIQETLINSDGEDDTKTIF